MLALATVTMPILDPSACTIGQRYVPPGGTFKNGGSTTTGGCESAGIFTTTYGAPNWGIIAAVGIVVLVFILHRN